MDKGPEAGKHKDCLGIREEAHLSQTEAVISTLGKLRARTVCWSGLGLD